MNNKITDSSERVSVRALMAVALSLMMIGCEAPLDLSGVRAEQDRAIRRFDQFKAGAANKERTVLVGDSGVVVSSADQGTSWQRIEFPGNTSLIDIATCPDGSFAILDMARKVWVSGSDSKRWSSRELPTEESPMALACDSQGQLWVTASFSTILSSRDRGENWQSFSLEEDVQLGTIQFVSEQFAVVTGEFGTFLYSNDGGQSWQRGNNLPGEFYPLSAYFADAQQGWVSGLSGSILHTSDGGRTWQRQPTPTQAPLYSLVGGGSAEGKGDALYAAGDNGVLLRLRAGQWEAVDETPDGPSYLIAMVPLPDHRLLVGGGSGAVGVVSIEQEQGREQGAELVGAGS